MGNRLAETWSGQAPLRWATDALAEAGLEQPRLEAQLLLAHLLGVSRAAVIAEAHPPLSRTQEARFERLVRKRARRIPHAYLRGVQEFYGLPFRVGPGVLVPRPETEMLVDFVIAEQRRRGEAPLRFADVGTGSGCIAIAALVHCPEARGVAFEISEDALTLARRNAALNGVESRIRFVRGDLLSGTVAERCDLIVSNPPYIPAAEIAALQPEIRDFEPRLALDGGPDGLDAYRALAMQMRRALKPGGKLAVEIGRGQAPDVIALLRGAGMGAIRVQVDLAGIERVVSAQREEKP